MSGFCGWIATASLPDAEQVIRQMADALPAHGNLLNEAAEQGWCGLASRARKSNGASFHDERIWATLEGYPHWSDPELERLAQERGHAAALAMAYERHGKGLLERLHGPVSFAVIDHKNRSALAAIDRAGIQTLSYAETKDGLVFGATTDSVRAHPAVDATIHPQSFYDFLYFVDRIPAPHSVYREQKKLVPGEYLAFANGRVEVASYWQMPYRDGISGNADELKRELLEHLRTAVTPVAAYPDLGAYLSGGLDSSTVVALLSEQRSDPLKTFTIAFDDPRFDESPYADLIAERFATDHDSYTVEPERVEEIIVRIAQAYDEPFGNSSAIPTYLCALRAKEAGVAMMAAGDGGDEFFAGNARYLEDQVFDHYARVPSPIRKALMEPALALAPFKERITLLRRANKYVQLASMSVAERFVRNNIFIERDYREIFSPDAIAMIDPRAPLHFVEAMYETPASRDKLHRLFYIDQRLTLADSDLRKVCRMCDLADVEVRFPFLDEDLMAFSAQIPPQLMLKDGRLRAFYKEALSTVLPQETLEKSKHGFGLPYLRFLKESPVLRDLARTSLEELRDYGLFRADFLNQLAQRLDSASDGQEDSAIWDFLVVRQWLASRDGLSFA